MTPSSSASSISHGCAGSSSMDSSAVIVHSVAPDSQRHARAVDGHVAAADDQHALALDAGVVLPVAGLEELQRADDALGVGAGNRDDAALLQAGGDQHRVVLADEVVDRHVVADRGVEPQVHAHADEVVDLLLDDVARQPVRRHAREQRAAGVMVLLVHRDAVAEPHQVVGRGQTARPAADDRDGLLARLRQRLHALLANLGVALVGDAVQRTDRDRLVVVVALARRLARVVADAAENPGHDVAVAHELVGLGDTVLGQVVGLAARVDVRRAVADARRQAIGRVQRLDERVVLRRSRRRSSGMSSRPRMPVSRKRTAPARRERELLGGIAQGLRA